MKTDIAVIEEKVDSCWKTVAYIGPDREGGFINIKDGRLRLRYLQNLEKRGEDAGGLDDFRR